MATIRAHSQALAADLLREHDENGLHTDITATSVTTTGDVTVGGALNVATFAADTITLAGTDLGAAQAPYLATVDQDVSVDGTPRFDSITINNNAVPGNPASDRAMFYTVAAGTTPNHVQTVYMRFPSGVDAVVGSIIS